MKLVPFFLLAFFMSANNLLAQDTIIPLWPSAVPNQMDIGEREVDTLENIRWIRNVQNPAIEVYLPSTRNNRGKAVLLFPGGGYHGLAYNWEGVDFAKALNAHGVAGIVVKYRLPISKSITKERWNVPLQDAQRAIRLVRSMADTWGLKSNQIGILGFSAGGHLASSLGVHFKEEVYPKQDEIDALDARPDFMGLIYPVITLTDPYTHEGSRNGLLGEDLPEERIKFYSNELQVKANTPPAFLLHAEDDQGVVVENSLRFYEALHKQNVPASLHIYPSGGHGFGLALDNPLLANWLNLFLAWSDTLFD